MQPPGCIVAIGSASCNQKVARYHCCKNVTETSACGFVRGADYTVHSPRRGGASKSRCATEERNRKSSGVKLVHTPKGITRLNSRRIYQCQDGSPTIFSDTLRLLGASQSHKRKCRHAPR